MIYHFSPPNEDFDIINEEEIQYGIQVCAPPLGECRMVVNSKRPHITNKPFDTTQIKSAAWDSRVVEIILFCNVHIVRILEDLQAWNYPTFPIGNPPTNLRNKLSATLYREFENQYFKVGKAIQDQWLKDFYTVHPEYKGVIITVNFEDPVYRRTALASFDKALPVVADWCMATFSQHRDMWCIPPDEDDEIVDIASIVLEEEEQEEINGSFNSVKTLKKTAKQVRQEILNAMTPRDRVIFLASEKNKKKIARLEREGLLEDLGDILTAPDL